MRYITSKEAAKLWSVSERRAQMFCREGRVSGATKFQGAWMVPADAKKPVDPRAAGAEASASLFALPMHTSLYSDPGSADAALAALPPGSPEARVFGAQLAYYRGNIAEAESLSEALIADASLPPICVIWALVGSALCAMYQGRASVIREASERLTRIRDGGGPCAVHAAMYLGVLWDSLYDPSQVPDWMREGRLDVLPEDTLPTGWMFYSQYLLLTKRYDALLAVSGPLLAMCRARGAVIPQIYLNIYASVSAIELGEGEWADRYLAEAISLSLPDGIFAPLAEFRRQLGMRLDTQLRALDPEALGRIRKLNVDLLDNWTALYNALLGKRLTNLLTAREYEAAFLAARHMTNRDIAERMNISPSAVKQYLYTVYQKLNVSNRDQLRPLVGMDDPPFI